MSTLKVNAIRQTAATSDAITLASDGTCMAKVTNNLSNRNLIINGAMNVAQRGTSSTTSASYTCDRFRVKWSGQDEVLTYSQHALTSSDTGPWAKGFRNSLHVQNGNQTGGAGAADYANINYRVEAQDVAGSGWDYTSASSYITLSFWVKSSVAQTFYFIITNGDGTTYNYPIETGSLTADTWTKVTKTIPGNSNLTINNDNGNGLEFDIQLFRGTDTTGSVTLNQWATFASATRCPDVTSTWWTTNDSTFEITGVQLEVGEVATDFEHRSYADELLRCQRYFYMRADGSEATSAAIAEGRFMSGSEVDFMTFFPVTMRATPSIYQVTGADYFALKASGYNQNVDGNWTLQWSQPNGTSHYATPDATGTTNMPAQIILMNAAARLGYNAEL